MAVASTAASAVSLLPAGRVKNAILRRLGWSIGANVRFGPSLVVNCARVNIGDNVSVGAFNVFRDLGGIEIGGNSTIGQWNWFTASMHMRQAGAPGTFVLGGQSALTSRHYVDCTGGVRVGAFTTVAGVRSTFLTHGISWTSSDQTYTPVQIGDYCLLSSNVQLAPGTVIGDRVVVALGSTIAGELLEPGLYVQPRAALVKSNLPGRYFERQLGAVEDVRPR